MPRKRFEDLTVEELMAYEQTEMYARGRSDAFDHGKCETILEYWNRDEPTDDELRSIVKNLVAKMEGMPP